MTQCYACLRPAPEPKPGIPARCGTLFCPLGPVNWFGHPGVRDPEFPCAGFEPGEPAAVPFAGVVCMTDGHYMCRECVHGPPPCKGCGETRYPHDWRKCPEADG